MTFSLIYSFKLAHNGNFDGKYGQKPPFIMPWLHKKAGYTCFFFFIIFLKNVPLLVVVQSFTKLTL